MTSSKLSHAQILEIARSLVAALEASAPASRKTKVEPKNVEDVPAKQAPEPVATSEESSSGEPPKAPKPARKPAAKKAAAPSLVL